MIFDTLSDYVQFLDEHDQLEVVRGADWDLEIGGLTTLMVQNRPSPALLFDEVEDHEPGYRVLTNALTTPFQWSAAGGFEPTSSKKEAVIAQKNRSDVSELHPPEEVTDGPVLQNVQRDSEVDVTKFPTPKWNEKDGGRYIGTADVILTRNADKGEVNAGTYRVQVHGPDEVTVMIIPGKDGMANRRSYLEAGEPCPMAISVGHPPDLFIGANERIPSEINELEYIGGRRGEPVEVIPGEATGLPIPAAADIVLEGHIYPDSEPLEEGPFGEWTGYMGDEQLIKPLKVERVYHADDPIILGLALVRPPAQIKSEIRNAARLWAELEASGLPGIHEVNTMPFGPNGWFDVISVDQQYAGHSIQVGLSALSGPTGTVNGRFTVIVDSDVDVFDQDEVLWAMVSRCDPATDLHVEGPLGSGHLDPTISPERHAEEDFTASRVVVDATRPYTWRNQYSAVNEPSDEHESAIREKYSQLIERVEGST